LKGKIMARKQGNPPTTHTVEAGDTLFDIAQAYYGDGNQGRIQLSWNYNYGGMALS
jgi:nucleoid-associated protein YgaU